MKLWKNKKIKVFFVVCLFVVMPLVSNAEDYDYYVDRSALKSGDGSKEKPFKTITEAVEKGGDIFVENGKYNESIELKKATRLYGKSESGVVVLGKIIMNDNTRIQDLTVRGVKTVITINKDADAEIENCTIRDFGEVGIKAVSGSGKLKVSNSKITNGDGKGFYIERGKVIELLSNEVLDNDEEGVDIRSKVKGVVKNNIISNNGESGIELIIGSSNLKVENNTIKRNGASGIATQFYPERDNKGQVNIINNGIGENKKYGLDCNRPQGGVPSSSYWKDSIELAGNSIYANQIKSINDYCDLIDVVDDDEAADNAIKDAGYKDEMFNDKKNAESELTEEEKGRIEMEEEVERRIKKQRLGEIESILEKRELFDTEIEKAIQELKNENRIKIFFLGISTEKVDNLLLKIENKESELKKLQLLMEEIDLEAEEEISIQENLDDMMNTINQQREVVSKEKNSFNLWMWVKSLFK